MHVAVAGLNHNTASVEVRERLAVPDRRLPDVLGGLLENEAVQECVLVSTCNRTELYAALDETPEDFLAAALGRLGDLPLEELRPHLYVHEGVDAVRHLFRVAGGLDSMVLGENQILAQVRGAYEIALEASATGTLTNRLFEMALATGKRVRTETGISRGSVSVGSVAVELAGSIFGDLPGRRVLLLGAGEMGEVVLERLVQGGASGVIVANRTHARAQALAERFGGRAVRFDQFEDEMTQADIVIASTASPHFVVRREPFEQVMLRRRMRPIFLIDIAVPRDVDPAIGEMDCAFLYDIDDLNSIVANSTRQRRTEAERAEEIVEDGVLEFLKWRHTQIAVPVIRDLRGRLQRMADEELERYSRRLAHLDEKDQELVHEVVRALVNKITHHPITHIKDYASENGADRLQTVVEVFGIDHERETKSSDTEATKEEGES